MKTIKKVTILVDNDSWILPYANALVRDINELNIAVQLVRHEKDISPGDISFLLGCTKIISVESLNKNRHNLVVHESALPKGKGFAPMAWQIMDNQQSITFSLIEAAEKYDSGDIWLQEPLTLTGYELCDEWRKQQGIKTVKLCLAFITNYKNLKPKKQVGKGSTYKRRTLKDSELNTSASIKELFPLLRTVDNERYPAYFYIDDVRYTLKIERD